MKNRPIKNPAKAIMKTAPRTDSILNVKKFRMLIWSDDHGTVFVRVTIIMITENTNFGKCISV